MTCYKCHLPADGPMLHVTGYYLHVPCVLRMLNELLDPDWEPGREPEAIVGVLPTLT